MMSFRVDDAEALEAQRWAERLGVDRSALLREALHRHLTRLASENDAEIWELRSLDAGEKSLADVADWGPAEDWSDWAVNFDNIHTIPRSAFRRRLVKLEPHRLAQACRRVRDAIGC